MAKTTRFLDVHNRSCLFEDAQTHNIPQLPKLIQSTIHKTKGFQGTRMAHFRGCAPTGFRWAPCGLVETCNLEKKCNAKKAMQIQKRIAFVFAYSHLFPQKSCLSTWSVVSVAFAPTFCIVIFGTYLDDCNFFAESRLSSGSLNRFFSAIVPHFSFRVSLRIASLIYLSFTYFSRYRNPRTRPIPQHSKGADVILSLSLSLQSWHLKTL